MALERIDKDPEDHRALEQIRKRLDTFTRSLETFYLASFVTPQEVPADGSGIPEWETLELAQKSIGRNIKALQDVLSEHSAFLDEAHVHPNASFPFYKEGMNAQLLRKRLNPDVEAWIAKRRKIGQSLNRSTASEHSNDTSIRVDDEGSTKVGMAMDEWTELWDFAGPEAVRICIEHMPEFDPNGNGVSEGGDDEVNPRANMAAESIEKELDLGEAMRFMSTGALARSRLFDRGLD